jgi:hypothetical protein
MTLTLTQLRARVRTNIRDTAGDFVTDADITQWLNEAMIDIASRQEILENVFTGTWGATNDLALETLSATTEVLTIQQLLLGTSGDNVIFVDDDIWQSYADSGADPGYTLGKVYAETIYLYPTPDFGTEYQLQATVTPVVLAADGDVHPLPQGFEPNMIQYATGFAYYKLSEPGLGDRMMQMYEQGLFPKTTGRETTKPGPITLIPVEGPFDVDVAARHY